MRIVREFSKMGMLITIFQYEGKYSVSIKDGLYEQIYKLRTGVATSPEALLEVLDDDFCRRTSALFQQMRMNWENSLPADPKLDTDEYPTIL